MTQTLHDPRDWTAATLDPPASWYVAVPAECAAILRARAGPGRPATDARLTPAERSACRQILRGVRHTLEHGRGFVILDGIGVDSDEEARTVYWLVGQVLGEPCAQNVQGTQLYDVRNTGADLSQGARFSVTSYESSFHTDNSFGATLADYVGLLCLRVARSGGVNYLVSGLAVHRILCAEYPDALAVLCEPFHVDRRGGTREGEAPTVQYPVIGEDGRGLVYRYLRYWIEAGHQKVGVPLTAAQTAALDTLDGVLARPELRAEFALKPGQMLWINNRWLLHNRTAFVDHDEPHRRRHLVRLWVRADEGG